MMPGKAIHPAHPQVEDCPDPNQPHQISYNLTIIGIMKSYYHGKRSSIVQVIQSPRHHSWLERSNHRAGCGFRHNPLCSYVLATQVEPSPPV